MRIENWDKVDLVADLDAGRSPSKELVMCLVDSEVPSEMLRLTRTITGGSRMALLVCKR